MVSITSLLFCILMPAMIHFSDFTALRWIAMLNSALEFQTDVRKLGATSKHGVERQPGWVMCRTQEERPESHEWGGGRERRWGRGGEGEGEQ